MMTGTPCRMSRNRSSRRIAWLTAVILSLCLQGAGQQDELAVARAAAAEHHYSEALAMIQRVLAARPQDLDARLACAQVLSWAGRYSEGIREYDAVLAADPHNEDAITGRARVLYWSGRWSEAAASLRDAEGPEARLLLAEIERARGQNGRALAALDRAGAAGEPLRSNILKELRPVLRFGYTLEDDRDLPESGAGSTIRAARYTAAVAFNLRPDLRMEISSVTTQASTSSPGAAILGAGAVAEATMARIRFRPAQWLEMDIGAGAGITGGAEAGPGIDGIHRRHFLYLLHPVVRWRGFRLDLAATRGLGDYTPLAIHNNLVEQRETVAASYSWRRLKAGGEYWNAGYSLQSPNMTGPHDWQTSADGGAGFVTPILHRSDNLLIESGARFEAYRFASSASLIPSPGFFTPQSYQQYGGTGHAWWRPHPHVEIDVSGLLGTKRFFLFDNSGAHGFDLTGSVTSRVAFNLGRTQPYVAYGYSSTQTAAAGAAAANYNVHVIGVGVKIRF